MGNFKAYYLATADDTDDQVLLFHDDVMIASLFHTGPTYEIGLFSDEAEPREVKMPLQDFLEAIDMAKQKL